MTDVIAALDQGTTSSRCILFDADGTPVGSAQREHRQICPAPGWVEHDAAEIWRATESVIRGALLAAGKTGADVAAVGITNQRETSVFWDRRTGKPLCNAIVWQDTRTASLCEELGGEVGADRFRDRTGLPIATYFSGPKITWALEHVDGFAAAATRGDAAVGTIDAWLIWNLTGGVDGGLHLTDVTNASRTLLFDLATLDWSDELLDAMGVARGLLPEVRSSAAPDGFGRTRADGPFQAAVPITGVLGDQQAALVGQLGTRPGDAKCTYGTGCFLLQNTGTTPRASTHGLLTTVAYRFGDAPASYALEGSVAIGGAVVQWLRDNLGILESAAQVEELAREVDDAGGVVFVPAFSGLFAPHWRSDARGVIVGLTRFTNRCHIARAALDAVAWQTRELVDAMASDAGSGLDSLNVDGGMVVNDLLMQLQADVLGIPVRRPAVIETTALGAAVAAGVAIGFYPDFDVLRERRAASVRFEPGLDDAARARGYDQWKRAVDRTLDWVRP